ncbi:hypothetical protein ACVWXO_009803 [Bradyrhizobium sp. LM2.7]
MHKAVVLDKRAERVLIQDPLPQARVVARPVTTPDCGNGLLG